MSSPETGKLTKSPLLQWNDSIITSTYHDVQIKQVQIVEKKNIVKFDESKIADQQSEASGRQSRVKLFAPPPSVEGEQNIEDTLQPSDKNRINSRRQSAVSFDIPNEKKIEERPIQPHNPLPTAPVINVPIEPVGISMTKTAPISKPASRQIDRTIREKRRMKLSQQRVIDKARSPLDRRLSSGIRRAKLYEVSPGVFVSELPPNVPQTAPDSRMNSDVFYQDIKVPYIIERAKTSLPHATRSVIWTSKNRFGSSRAVSSLSSAKWKLQQDTMSDPMKRVNMFVKMPFKQTPYVTMNKDVKIQGDDVVQANDDLRLATAFTVSRVRKAIQQMESPGNTGKAHGRLLKGKLKPLRPVKNNGPTVNDCCGIQPENKKVRSYSPSPSRQRHLKEELQMAILNHRAKVEEELERRMQVQSTMSHESMHMTSPEPPLRNNAENEAMFYLNEETNLYADKISESSYENKIASQIGSVTLESAVIY